LHPKAVCGPCRFSPVLRSSLNLAKLNMIVDFVLFMHIDTGFQNAQS